MALSFSSLKQIAGTVGVSVTFVKALAGLSRPARSALRLQLNSLKQSLQADLSTLAFKARIAKRKQIEINKAFSSASATLSQAKRVLNLLNFGPEFNDEPEIQKLIDTLLSKAKIKGISLGGYKDADNIVNAINFKAQQVARAVDFAEVGVNTINQKINEVDKYLNTLTAIDTLD